MSRKRNMPSKIKIFNYWSGKLKNALSDNTCFKCGIYSNDNKINIVDRAHILSVFDGGTNNLDNLHLLCKKCHTESEPYSGIEYDLWLSSENNEQFFKSLFFLIEKGIIKNEELSLCINKLKEIYIKRNFDYDVYMLKIALENHTHIQPFYDMKNIIKNLNYETRRFN